MYFLNLNELKIKKSYNYTTYQGLIENEDLLGMSLIKMREHAGQAVKEILAQRSPIETCYEITLASNDAAATDEEVESFYTFVNICASEFFQQIVDMQKHRNRERRLDVPEGLRAVKTSFSVIKRAVNYETIIDNFNLVIKYKDLVYTLCNEKEEA